MQGRAMIQTVLQAALVLALLLGTATQALAQDTGPLVVGSGTQNAAADDDPNGSSVDDVLDEQRGDTTAGGPTTSDDPAQLVGTDAAEYDADSTRSGPQVDETGERGVPFVGDSLLFLPAVKSDGTANTRMTSESSAAAVGGTPAGQNLLGDFNGDGYDDLAVGIPNEDVTAGGIDNYDAGAVTVIYGSAAGLTAAGNQVWTQGTADMPDVVEPGDAFGYALAVGDFNADGSDDLAVGVPNEGFGGLAAAGAVQIIYGSTTGLAAAGSQIWTQDSAGVLEVAESGDRFGAALAAGDFNGDGRADLAIGVPNEDIAGIIDAGVVQVMYGSQAGLAVAGNQQWHQSVAGIPDLVETADQFGSTLAVGDFDADGKADLAIGVPYEDLGATVDGGVVHVMRGSAAGLTAAGSRLYSADIIGVADGPGVGDCFGWALAAGDFDGSGAHDLAIGIPYKDLTTTTGTAVNAGAVNVLFGAAGDGLNANTGQLWSQGSAGLADAAETGDTFGYALATGQFDGSGPADLVIGVPSEDIATELNTVSTTVNNGGAVHIVHGPLGSAANELWTQDSPGVLDAAEAGDLFGLTVAMGDFDGSGGDDLVAGVPLEDLGGIADTGAVNVLYGPLGGTQQSVQQFWSQDSAGILGVGEAGDGFGLVNQ